MSLSLFNAVLAGSIEVLSDAKGAPYFKRADLGRFLGIANVREYVATTSRESLIQGCQAARHPTQSQNDHDAFVDLEAALEIVVRSRKPKAVEIVKWLTRKGVEKVVEEKQKAMEEKDTQLAFLNDDLTEAVELVKQLEYNNTGLQGD